MHLLILGGSHHNRGGVEAFCERAKEALQQGGTWSVSHRLTGTNFLTLRRLPAFLGNLLSLINCRRESIDTIWLQYVTLPDLTYLIAAKMLGFKVLVTPHLGANWRSQSNPLLRELSSWLLTFADRLALLSTTQEQEIKLPLTVPRCYIRTFLPGNIVSTYLPDLKFSTRELQLVHAGRLSEGKGTFSFVSVCHELRTAGIPFAARIAGAADEQTACRLKKMISDYSLEDHIAVLGQLSAAELVRVLRSSDVLVHLSRIDSYPLIVLESLACSAFPVCLDIAGARDMIATYDGRTVSQKTAVEETVDFLSRHDLNEIRSRSRAAALHVQSDYKWDLCVRAVEAAVCENPEGSSGSAVATSG